MYTLQLQVYMLLLMAVDLVNWLRKRMAVLFLKLIQ